MAPLYDGHDYYKKMLELQEKLRKSEEERIRLEERFKILVQESRNRHDACINRLRLRYIEFLEEQRARDERNHKLLGALDRVDNSLALMSAKTDRLNVLRKQYEAYLLRVYANRGRPGSITGDSGIASQNENRYSRRNMPAAQIDLISPQMKNNTSPRISQSNYPTNQSALSFESKVNEMIQNIPRDEIVETSSIRVYNTNYQQQPNSHRSQNTSDVQNVSPQAYRNVREAHDTNIDLRSTVYNCQANSSPRMQFEKSLLPQTSRLRQQNTLQPNKSMTERVETVQTMPQFIMTGFNANTSEHKSQDISQNQIALPVSQHQFNPLPITQSLRQPSSGTQLNNKQSEIRSNDPLFSPNFGSMLPITELNASDENPLNVPLNSAKHIHSIPNYLNYPLDNTEDIKKSIDDIPACTLTSSEVDNMIKRNERLTLKHLNARRVPHKFSTTLRQAPSGNDDGRTMMIVESELDKYIGKIRNLHRELDMQSLEEIDHEQNTSGDLLNVTLSDDDLEFPMENKPKEEQLPEEVEKVLALATDLASRTVNSDDVNRSGKQHQSENRSVELTQAQQNGAPTSERSHAILSETYEGRGTSGVELQKDEIRNDISLHQPELDQRENIENVVKQDSDRSNDTPLLETRTHASQLFNVHTDPGGTSHSRLSKTIPTEESNKNNLSQNAKQGSLIKDNNKIHAGKEQELEQHHSFGDLEALEPWNIDRVEKQVQEIVLCDVDKDNFTEKEVPMVITTDENKLEEIEVSKKIDTAGTSRNQNGNLEKTVSNTMSIERESELQREKSMEIAMDSTERNEYECHIDGTSDNKIEQLSQNHLTNQNAQESSTECAENESKELEVKEKQIEVENLATNEIENGQSQIMQNNMQDQQFTELSQEYTSHQTVPYESDVTTEYQAYAEESNQQYDEYVTEQYNQYANPDDQYVQDPTVQYEQDPNVQYEQDPNVQYEQDPNIQYEENVNVQYEQDPNIEYDQNINAQYENGSNVQYEQDVNIQYEQDTNMQYEQDPNVQYEQDTNAQYGQDPNVQYDQDSNQQYMYNYDQEVYQNQTNQSNTYDDNVPYDPEQTNITEAQQQMQSQEYEKEENNLKSEEAMEEESNVVERKDEEQTEEPALPQKKKDVIKALLESDTESTESKIERNVSNTESDFDFN